MKGQQHFQNRLVSRLPPIFSLSRSIKRPLPIDNRANEEPTKTITINRPKVNITEAEADNQDDVIVVSTSRIAGKRKPNKDTYTKTGPSAQDIISANSTLFAKKLENFDLIPEEHYSDIDLGTFIRYIIFDEDGVPKIRLGGFLVVNNAPDYFVLRSAGLKRLTWSVNLKSTHPLRKANKLYMKKGTRRISQKPGDAIVAEKLLQAVLSGRYKLVETSLLSEMENDGTLSKKERKTPKLDL